jgi:hypothetical protein
MAFTQEVNRVATSIRGINVILYDAPDGQGGNIQSAKITIDVLDQDGNLLNHIETNLVPHVTQAQIDGLLNFMNSIRTQAEVELLP